MKKLPDGWVSWVSFYDYLKSQGHIDSPKVTFYTQSSEGFNVKPKKYSITMATVERNCWREIQHLRPSASTAHEAGAILHADAFNAGRMSEVIRLLWAIEKRCEIL